MYKKRSAVYTLGYKSIEPQPAAKKSPCCSFTLVSQLTLLLKKLGQFSLFSKE